MKPEKTPIRKSAKEKPESAAPAQAKSTTKAAAKPEPKKTSPAPPTTPKPSTAPITPSETKASATPKTPEKKQPIAQPPADASSAQSSIPPALEKSAKPVRSKKPTAAAPTRTTEKLVVPPILLEGDATPAPLPSGPGTRYALSATPPAVPPSTLEDLPQSYGTGKLFLTARDPHWLYAAWDFTIEQQRAFNARSRDGHLILRVHFDGVEGPISAEVHAHPESRNWFIFVGKADTRYTAELGYYDAKNKWRNVATSQSTLTPPDTLAEDITADFATIPSEIPFAKLMEAVQEFVGENLPLVEAIERAREKAIEDQQRAQTPPAGPISPEPTQPSEPFRRPIFNGEEQPSRPWTSARAAELASMVTMDSLRRIWMGSLEITEVIKRRLQKDISSIAAAELARGAEVSEMPGGLRAVSSVSSPFGVMPARGRKFWFNINAELIIYGATEQDATVTIGDREIQLRPDGSFSYRFALPDGRFELPIEARSSDAEESRLAALRFSRFTDYRGHVEAHPQDAALKTPEVKNV